MIRDKEECTDISDLDSNERNVGFYCFFFKFVIQYMFRGIFKIKRDRGVVFFVRYSSIVCFRSCCTSAIMVLHPMMQIYITLAYSTSMSYILQIWNDSQNLLSYMPPFTRRLVIIILNLLQHQAFLYLNLFRTFLYHPPKILNHDHSTHTGCR